MNANNIINESMTLEEKLEAIDKALKEASIKQNVFNPDEPPVDPSELLMCEGCQ